MADATYIDEEWRTIVEAPDYSISSYGRVKRTTADWQGKYLGRVLANRANRGGYLYHVLRVDMTNQITRTVHRMVCTAFNGPCPPEKSHCAHIDGDRKNNVAWNLYWATAKENIADKIRHGRVSSGLRNGRHTKPENTCRGEMAPAAKLKEADVRYIRNFSTEKGTGVYLAEKFGVSTGLIYAIRIRRIWKHID